MRSLLLTAIALVMLACAPPLAAQTCTPTTCAQLGAQCGPASDGCGGSYVRQLPCGSDVHRRQMRDQHLHAQDLCPTGLSLWSGKQRLWWYVELRHLR